MSQRRRYGRQTGVEGNVSSSIRWPRGLGAAGLVAGVVSVWGALVAFLGPAIGLHANTSPAWHWSAPHAWLYVLPGAVGALVSLGIVSRSGGGRAATRVSLGMLGVVLAACGAWFVLGPSAWSVVSTGGAFSNNQGALTRFTAVVGYNLGVGLVLALIGGVVVSASLGERELALVQREQPLATPYPANGPDTPVAPPE